MSNDDSTTRRTYLKATGAGAAALALAGCTGGSGGGDGGNGGSSGGGTGGGAGTETGGGGGSDGQTIVIGSDIPYKPFEYRTNQGELVGFDVEIADAVFGKQLGMTPTFKPTAFDGIINGLNNGNFRVIMSAMTITKDRAEEVDFSDPYFTAYQTIVVLKNSDIQQKSDLKGQTIGVQKGTTGADAAAELKKEFDGDLTVQSYDQIPDAFSALINNQVTAVVNDNTVSEKFVNENADTVRFVKGKGEAAKQGKNAPPYLTLTVEEYGIAFRKGDDLQKRVNEALSTIRDNGSYDKLYKKYFES